MQPKLTYNCPEKWEDMKVGLVERYCGQCNKHVHDFTSMSREEIYKFFQEHKNEQVCGRILPSQLDYQHRERMVVVQALLNKKCRNNIAFYLLALGSITILSCNNVGDSGQSTKADTTVTANGHKHRPECGHHGDTTTTPPELPVLGMLGPPSTTAQMPDTTEPYWVVEQMPEFKGGEDKLIAYLQEHIKYPAYEKKNNITGTVYVKFVIDKKGKVIKPEIIRNTVKSENFEKEVLRVVNQMPNWVPGKQDGKNVAVTVALPVAFKR